MPSKSRWALNPRKWFGMKSNATNKHEKNSNSGARTFPPPPSTATTTTTTRTMPSISTIPIPIPIPKILAVKNKLKVPPVSISNDFNKNNRTTSTTQLQLPAFGVRREKTIIPSFNRQSTFQRVHTEPTIRKNRRIEVDLSIDTKRWNVPALPTLSHETPKQEHFRLKQMAMTLSEMSRRCLIDYPSHSTNVLEESSFPTRSSSSSSIMDDNDNSSSSGIFTDERQNTESKDTLSTVEVLSMESIADSHTSLNHLNTRPIIHHYRRPMSVFETNDDKPQQSQIPLKRSHRSHSAEGTLKDNSTSKSRQAGAIIKKLDKRIPKNQSSSTLEKAGFVRVAHDVYRLTVNQIVNSSYPRKHSIDSFIPDPNSDDSLRSANDEECYAALPRTSSTEQLNNNIQNDLRIIVDECIRPMVKSIGKSRLTTRNPRYKRPNAHTQLNIENITDKLLSSIDYPIYTRYQRGN
jgi:hypothetical protein